MPNGLQLAAMGAGAGAGLGRAAVDQLAKRINEYANTAVANAGKQSIRQKGRAANRKARAGQRQSGGPVNGYNPVRNMSIPRPQSLNFSMANTCRATFKDVIGLSNGASSSICAAGYTLSFATLSAFAPFQTTLPRAYSVAAAYREFYLNSITVTFISNTGDATGGSLAVGVDPDEQAGTPTSFGDVVRHNCSFFADIKGGGEFTYRPRADQKDKKFISNNSRTEGDLSFGLLQAYSTNGVPTSTNIANLMVVVDITFIGPR